MGKPLLTDEIIARANRGEFDQEMETIDREETIVMDRRELEMAFQDEDDSLAEEEVEVSKIIKSRRIENARRGEFQSKINRILLIILFLVILLFWAVFKL